MDVKESADGVAKKWFFITFVGCVVYFSVVFSFVINGEPDPFATPTAAEASHD